MNAMVLRAPDSIASSPLIPEEMASPEPGAGEVRVRVLACGICRTDLHIVEGELPQVRSPLIPGHQVVGVVEAVGPGSTRFRVGERVGIAWLRWTCGLCGFCRAGRENLCEASQYTGYHADGGYAQYAVVAEAFAYPIPAVFGDAEATPLLCAGIIGYRALRRSQVPPGGRLGIYGFGSSAHITMQVALHRGCKVYVCTRGDSHRELALAMGATWVGDMGERVPVKMDSSILFAPAGDLVPVALRDLEKGGTLALAGIYMSDVPRMAYAEHLFYEKNLRSVTANTRKDGEELFREAAQIPIRPRTQAFPLAEANRALQLLKADRITGSGVLVID